MEDPEEIYNENIEKEDELFLKGLQEGKNPENLEKNYKRKTEKLRIKYEKDYKKYLKKNPNAEEKKKKKEGGKKVFRVKHLNLEQTWKDKLYLKKESKKFKTKRKLIDILERITPGFILRIYYKVKKIFRIVFFEIRMFSEKLLIKISGRVKKIFGSIGDFFEKVSSVYIKIKEFIIGQVKKIFKKNKKGKEEGKKEEGKKNGEQPASGKN